MIRNYLDILSETIRNNWDQPALTDFYLTEDGKAQDTSRGYHYTYGEMYAEIVRVADLLTNIGLRKGDHIAICGTNSAHWVIAYLAIAKMQGVSVTIVPSLQPDEIARLIDFSDAKALFVDPNIYNSLGRPILSDLSSVISLSDWSVMKGEKLSLLCWEDSEVSFPQSEPDSFAMICFTSGSSGIPRGVMLPLRSITNNVYNTWEVYPKEKNSQICSIIPYSHIFGFTSDMMGQITQAKHLSILREPLTAENIFAAIRIIKPYALTIIPLLLTSIYKRYHNTFLKELSSSCHFIAAGGAKLPSEMEQVCKEMNIQLSVGYGQTETGPAISGSPSLYARIHSCGKVFSGMTCRIAPSGEILVKGENVMLGYYKDPEATARKIDADGWLHTGDKGHLDEDGYLYVEGRLEQDIIVLPNGENIHPEDIERMINALPEVKESIVLARDGKLVAIVVPQITTDQSPMTNTDLRRTVLRKVNPSLPLYSQLYDVEITDTPLQKTEKQTIKRYLYK